MGRGGCAGVMTAFGPPSLLGVCYVVWDKGHSLAVRRSATSAVCQQSAATYATGLAALFGAYQTQRVLVFRHFDALGTGSWKQTVDVLGEPLKVSTWAQFYKLAGPPVLARVSGLIVSFYVAGWVQGAVAQKWNQPVPVTALPRSGGPAMDQRAREQPTGAASVSDAASSKAHTARPAVAAPDLTFEEFQRQHAAEQAARKR